MIICECGHGIDIHDSFGGCYGDNHKCPCMIKRDVVEARYWARRMMKERDETELDYLGIVSDEYDLELEIDKLIDECDALQSKYDFMLKECKDMETKLEEEIPYIDKFHRERDIANWKLDIARDVIKATINHLIILADGEYEKLLKDVLTKIGE